MDNLLPGDSMAGVSHAPLILITGGSRGVGAATARLAAAQGYDVAISFVADEAAAQAVLADVRAAWAPWPGGARR
jgi:NAD(P)-dependent dehydrogenase (short-subunit alcohol dehydrogenase family)